ncbi:Spy/CpxP family protein refolding chaperone [Marinagarivorans algicola]|uniref:Spy/CpxP family protein refolding chaperone n=1 Tax=Marinagarivorans algicola TaxID=1513270 RepID=UPI0006B45CE3|nr:Spy/CpxP family protein refolding chaperone [Marinagarivorans algicola]
MNMKQASAAFLATTALSFGLAGFTTQAIAKPYMDSHDKAHQCENRKAKKANKHLKRMTKQLNLTEQQVAAIKAIYEEDRIERTIIQSHSKRNGLMALDPGAPDYQEQVEAIAAKRAKAVESHILRRAQTMTKIHELLTPEQQVLASQHKARRLERLDR